VIENQGKVRPFLLFYSQCSTSNDHYTIKLSRIAIHAIYEGINDLDLITSNNYSHTHASYFKFVVADGVQAILYYTFSALQGYRPAQMALGYRHWAGIGVKEVCGFTLPLAGRVELHG